jgi:hypothetical protein
MRRVFSSLVRSGMHWVIWVNCNDEVFSVELLMGINNCHEGAGILASIRISPEPSVRR